MWYVIIGLQREVIIEHKKKKKKKTVMMCKIVRDEKLKYLKVNIWLKVPKIKCNNPKKPLATSAIGVSYNC
jgi:hypothetical protein